MEILSLEESELINYVPTGSGVLESQVVMQLKKLMEDVSVTLTHIDCDKKKYYIIEIFSTYLQFRAQPLIFFVCFAGGNTESRKRRD